MSGFPIIDLVVGLIFIYFLLSVICSSCVEIVQTYLQVRSKVLGQWLVTIFDQPVPGHNNKVLGQIIMDHCATIGLSRKGLAPNYMDAKNFASALVEQLTYDPANPVSIATDINQIKSELQQSTILSPEIKRTFLGFATEAEEIYKKTSDTTTSDIGVFKNKLEQWYDSTMDRLAGTLKRKYSQPFTAVIVAIVVILLNADSISLAQYLYKNPTVREQIVAQSQQALQTQSTQANKVPTGIINTANRTEITTPEQLQQTTDSLVNEIKAAQAQLTATLPLGWNNDTTTGSQWITKIMGLLVTMLAAFMGAPFWFDILNKVSNLRGTGPKPTSSANGDFNSPTGAKSRS